MGKNKLKKFADMEQLPNVFQLSYNDIVKTGAQFEMRGHWGERYFGNDNPIVLELGCGKGEYAVGLARQYPEKNFIGIDIKGARMWTGATEASQSGLKNGAFLRTGINAIEHFFAPGASVTVGTHQVTGSAFVLSHQRFFVGRYDLVTAISASVCAHTDLQLQRIKAGDQEQNGGHANGHQLPDPLGDQICRDKNTGNQRSQADDHDHPHRAPDGFVFLLQFFGHIQ